MAVRGDIRVFAMDTASETDATQVCPIERHTLQGVSPATRYDDNPTVKTHLFEVSQKLAIVTHRSIAEVSRRVVAGQVVMQMDVSNPAGMIAYGLQRIETPEHDVGHIQTQTTPYKPLQKAIPFCLTVYEVIHVGMPGYRHAEAFSVLSQILVRRSNSVQIGIARGASWSVAGALRHI
jgi:hypothetical protein